MNDKKLLAIRYATWIFLMVGLISTGLNVSVWQDAPSNYRFISQGIWLLPLTALIFIKSGLEKRKMRRVDMGLEQWSATDKRVRKFRRIFQIIFCLIAIIFILAGVAFWNRDLSFIGGGGFVVIVVLYTIDELVERAEKREQGKKEDTEK